MTSLAFGNRTAQHSVTGGARSVWMARLGRLGLGARGVLYILLAYLAMRVAFGQTNRETDKQGALQTVARQPFGHLLLAALALGFGAYAVWKLTIAAFGRVARGGSNRKSERVKALVTGIAYGFFAASAVALAVGSSGTAGGDKAEVDLTGKVMQHSFGRVLVFVVGAAVTVIGARLAWRALHGKREMPLRPVGRTIRRVVDTLAKIGLTAQAVIIAAAGIFVAQAALTFDPNKTKGLDGILKSFAQTPVGPWLLVVVAGGVFAFGAYSLALARYAAM